MPQPVMIQLLTEPDRRDSDGPQLPRSHIVRLPGHSDRQDLVVAYTRYSGRRDARVLRACAALVGLCTRIGQESGASWADAECSVLVYGGRVFDWLREQPGFDAAELGRAASQIASAILEADVPDVSEVAAARKNSPAGGAGSTAASSG